MRIRFFHSFFGIFSIALGALGCDRAFKIFAQNRGNQYLNTDILFFSNISQIFIVTLSAVVIVGLLFFWSQQRFSVVWLAVIIAGGCSNAYDRLVYGGVIDYWRIGTFVFNFADVCVWVGIVGTLAEFWYNERHSE